MSGKKAFSLSCAAFIFCTLISILSKNPSSWTILSLSSLASLNLFLGLWEAGK